MESISEVLEKINIVKDTKARRVLNTAPNQDSGITLASLNSGVTIETIEALEVPVYLYGGQLTIHGTFKDDVKDVRVAGYKSLFKNGNGSLGVKYVAVDGEKKSRLVKLSRLSPCKDSRWSLMMDSQGLQASRSFDNKEDALACYKNAPDCFVGTKTAFRGIYGNFYVCLDIGAIYEKDFWNLCKALTGLDEVSALEAEKQKALERKQDEERWAKEAEERKQKQELAKADREVWRAQAEAELLSKNFIQTSYCGFGVYIYAFASPISDKRGYVVARFSKGSFGRLMQTNVFFDKIENIDLNAVNSGFQKAKVVDETQMKILVQKKLFKKD